MHKTECNISLQITKEEVDEFEMRKRLPHVSFSTKWTRGDLKPTKHLEKIQLHGTKTLLSITVECCAGVLMDEGGVVMEEFVSLVCLASIHIRLMRA